MKLPYSFGTKTLVLTAMIAFMPAMTACGQQSLPASTWVTYDAEGEPQIQLYFFWSNRCPHCLEAKPFVDTMAQYHPWLNLHSLQLIGQPENTERYRTMAAGLGQKARSVPGFMFCGEMFTGYDKDETTGRALQRRLVECYQENLQKAGSE